MVFRGWLFQEKPLQYDRVREKKEERRTITLYHAAFIANDSVNLSDIMVAEALKGSSLGHKLFKTGVAYGEKKSFYVFFLLRIIKKPQGNVRFVRHLNSDLKNF